jgi:thiamine-monophosphate kinase
MSGKRIPPGGAIGELDLLRDIRTRALTAGRRSSVRVGIGDDCALLGLRAGEEVAVTTDLSIAGRHFRLEWHPPQSVGHRTLARGLSDLAAMGARPMAAFLSLGIPRQLTVRNRRGPSWVDGFFEGLLRLSAQHQAPLAGGDLAESPVALADIVLIGAVPVGRGLRRSGAGPGDLVYVTGSLGGAAAGLAKLAGSKTKYSSLRWTHFYPQPRISQGLALQRRRLATAGMDLSDGLSTDLAHLCEESGVSAVVQSELLPVARRASLEQALHGGEDYELLFTAPSTVRMPRSLGGIAITRIGHITRRLPGKPPVMIATGSRMEALAPSGWQHFRPQAMDPAQGSKRRGV